MDHGSPTTHDERSEHVVLAGDVGGTFVRLVLARNGALLGEPQELARERFTDLADACGDFLDRHGAGLRIEPVRRGERAIETRDGLPILEKVEGAALSDDDVRRLRDDLQR